MLKRVLRWMAWAVGGGVALVVVLVNLRDEPLDPRAARLLEPVPPRLANADNGYPDLVGLKAPAGADARAWGKAWLAGAAKVTDTDGARAFGEQFKSDAAKLDAFCNPLVVSCLEKVATSRPAAEALLRTHREVLARYQRLFDYAGIEETYDPVALASPVVAFSGVLATQSLQATALALRATERDLPRALDLLERDAALARKLLVGARLLLTKALAMTMFARDMALLSDLLRFRRAEMAPHAERAARIAAPLTAAERSMERAYQGEYRYLANTLLRFGRPEYRGDLGFDEVPVPAFVAGWLYQPNATVNLHHRLFEPMLAIDTTKMPPAVPPKAPPPDLLWSWTAPYNFVGKVLLTIGTPDLTNFATQVGDLDGLQRLVALQAAIVARRIPNDRVAAFVADQDRALSSPYTGQPMQWDAEKGQLGFAPRSVKWSNQKFGGRANWLAITL